MRRPVLAVIVSVVAAVAIAFVVMMSDAEAPLHHHETAVAAADPATYGAISGATAVPPSGSSTDPAGAAGSSWSATSSPPPAESAVPGTPTDSPVAAAAALEPAGDPAGHRQISLEEAAAAPVVDIPAVAVRPGSAAGWIDPEAVGVNDGTKKQAADVQLAPAPTVAPEEVLPSNGQISGCVTGYGRGAVCLPQTPPSHAGHGQSGGEDLSRYWTCAEVRELLPNGVVVDAPSTDILGLDTNLDGTACGAGDR